MNVTNTFLFTGVMVGFSIAVPIGPMALLCIQRTLTSGMRVGVCTGLGAATVNVFYGLLVILGFSNLAPILTGLGRAMNLAGSLFLLWSATQTFMRQRNYLAKDQPGTMVLAPRTAYGSAVAFNITNPMGPMLILALLSPSLATRSLSSVDMAALLTGMFLAASCWWICLTACVTILRARLSPELLILVNRTASVLLTIYAALALARFASA